MTLRAEGASHLPERHSPMALKFLSASIIIDDDAMIALPAPPALCVGLRWQSASIFDGPSNFVYNVNFQGRFHFLFDGPSNFRNFQ